MVNDKNGKPLYSWRVLILPYIEGDRLYKEFHLDEPWDSPHNLTLLEKMPSPFRPFNPRAKCPADHTFYRVFVGKNTAYEPSVQVKIGSMEKPGETFLVVEGATPVPWTKPDELTVEENQPLPPLAGVWPKWFKVAMADGSVQRFPKPLNEDEIRPMVYRVKPK